MHRGVDHGCDVLSESRRAAFGVHDKNSEVFKGSRQHFVFVGPIEVVAHQSVCAVEECGRIIDIFLAVDNNGYGAEEQAVDVISREAVVLRFLYVFAYHAYACF